MVAIHDQKGAFSTLESKVAPSDGHGLKRHTFRTANPSPVPSTPSNAILPAMRHARLAPAYFQALRGRMRVGRKKKKKKSLGAQKGVDPSAKCFKVTNTEAIPLSTANPAPMMAGPIQRIILMPTINVDTTIITAGGKEIDLASLPGKTINAMLRRGFTHFFGSEIASRVGAAKAKFEADNGRPMTEEEVDATKTELLAAGHVKVAEGTLGDRAVGQSVDPVEALVESLGRAEVKDMLRANDVKIPKKGEKITFAGGAELELEELVERWVVKNGERLEKEAKKQIAAKAKAKAALKVEGPVSIEALGF